MIPFDPMDPFPLLPIGSYSYATAKEHAVQADRWLGFQIDSIERKLSAQTVEPTDFPQERWVGLDAQSFLTPYIEIRSILDFLKPQTGELVVDLGCGYARMAHVLGRHHPFVSFVGYELVLERVIEAQRVLAPFDYPGVRIEQFDLVSSAPLEAKYYFIYDYGSKAAIDKTLQDLQQIARHQPIQVVARGRASRFFIQQHNPWLSEVHAPRHFETFSIYQS